MDVYDHLSVFKVMKDLGAHYRILHPIVAPFLASCKQIRSRFGVARSLLVPLIAARRSTTNAEYSDMIQWLIESAQGRNAETDQLVKRMLFLNMAAIHTSAEVTTNVLLDLCARPEYMKILLKEMSEAFKEHDGLKLATLTSLKKTDSFIKEVHRINPLGLSMYPHA